MVVVSWPGNIKPSSTMSSTTSLTWFASFCQSSRSCDDDDVSKYEYQFPHIHPTDHLFKRLLSRIERHIVHLGRKLKIKRFQKNYLFVPFGFDIIQFPIVPKGAPFCVDHHMLGPETVLKISFSFEKLWWERTTWILPLCQLLSPPSN